MQQFYNYEYKNWTRIKNNIASRKRYKNKQDNSDNETAQVEATNETSNESTINVPESDLEYENICF